MRQLAGLILVLVLGACSSAATSAPASAAAASSAPSSSAPSSAPSSATSGAPQSTAPAAGGLPADPCAILTVAELQQVTGQPFKPGVKNVTADSAECAWTHESGNGVVTVNFVKLDYGVFEQNGRNPGNTRVQGVGDEAYLVPTINSIDVAKGNLEFTVQPVLFGKLDWKKIATDLAKLVDARVSG